MFAPRIVQRGFARSGDAFPGGVDPDDAHGEFFADRHDVGSGFHIFEREFGERNQRIDAAAEVDERAEIGDANDGGFAVGADGQRFQHRRARGTAVVSNGAAMRDDEPFLLIVGIQDLQGDGRSDQAFDRLAFLGARLRCGQKCAIAVDVEHQAALDGAQHFAL